VSREAAASRREHQMTATSIPDVNLLAVLAATIAAFASGGAYYAVLGDRLAEVSDAAAAGEQPPPWTIAAELVRCLILAAVVAGLASQAAIDEWTGGVLLGLALWIGFPFVLWTGAVLHEGTPRRLALIHGGDWLIKLPVIAVIATVWQ
jgi:peptidoglycan/LPS O-acetylase OafA/YrhL